MRVPTHVIYLCTSLFSHARAYFYIKRVHYFIYTYRGMVVILYWTAALPKSRRTFRHRPREQRAREMGFSQTIFSFIIPRPKRDRHPQKPTAGLDLRRRYTSVVGPAYIVTGFTCTRDDDDDDDNII